MALNAALNVAMNRSDYRDYYIQHDENKRMENDNLEKRKRKRNEKLKIEN